MPTFTLPRIAHPRQWQHAAAATLSGPSRAHPTRAGGAAGAAALSGASSRSGAAAASAVPRCGASEDGRNGVQRQHSIHSAPPVPRMWAHAVAKACQFRGARFIFLCDRQCTTRAGGAGSMASKPDHAWGALSPLLVALELVSQSVHRACVRAIPTQPVERSSRRFARVRVALVQPHGDSTRVAASRRRRGWRR